MLDEWEGLFGTVIFLDSETEVQNKMHTMRVVVHICRCKSHLSWMQQRGMVGFLVLCDLNGGKPHLAHTHAQSHHTQYILYV